MARPLFTDGFNSFAHVMLGYFSYNYPTITPIFLVYQLTTRNKDTITDITEFIFGHFFNKIRK